MLPLVGHACPANITSSPTTQGSTCIQPTHLQALQQPQASQSFPGPCGPYPQDTAVHLAHARCSADVFMWVWGRNSVESDCFARMRPGFNPQHAR